jgi:hypothetical protein
MSIEEAEEIASIYREINMTFREQDLERKRRKKWLDE